MTDLICLWCGQPVPAGKAKWWDGRPQCPDPFACDKRIRKRIPGPKPAG